ncbi:MAG: glycerate kinase [Nitrososphaerales archaeon]
MIKNKKQLLHFNTCVKARRLVLDALDAALMASDPKKLVKEHVRLKGNNLRIADKTYQLDFDNIYVIGAGKASAYMAEAMNEILGERITDGLVIIPDYFRTRLHVGNIKLWRGTHPIPSERGVYGTRKMLGLVKDVSADDLVICLLSGGASALMPLPFENITIAQKSKVTNMLLRSGATIQEINAVRKHISAIKGGRLAEFLSRSKLVSLIISDVVGDRLDTIASGPTAPDDTTFRDVMDVLKKYGLWETLDQNVKDVVMKGLSGIIPETPKAGSKVFRNVSNFVIGNNRLACMGAINYIKSKKLKPVLLTTFMQGEAKEVGSVISSIALQINAGNGSFRKPICVIMGGETTVTVRHGGKGGRNQELVLSASRQIDGLKNTVIASIDTDGIDGNSEAAGAIADSSTFSRAHKLKISLSEFLHNNDSNTFFTKLNDVIKTGSTGTNVNDIVVMLCL